MWGEPVPLRSSSSGITVASLILQRALLASSPTLRVLTNFRFPGGFLLEFDSLPLLLDLHPQPGQP